MWICLSCRKQFELERSCWMTCPYCESPNIQEEMSSADQEDISRVYSARHVTPSVLSHTLSGCSKPSTTDDAAVISSLERYGSEWPEIFNLVWGIDPRVLKVFPKEHRKVVADILLEGLKEEESDDPIEKKLHHIIAELLYVEYRKHILTYVEEQTKRMNAAHNNRRR